MTETALLPYRNTALDARTRAADLAGRLTLEEKIESMVQYQPAIERLGIRAYKHGTEAAHGMAWLGEATAFPQPIGLGCTWNPELLKAVGSAIGDEARVYYERNPEVNGLTLWAPTVDMERDPRWGRTEEAYGEDPVLTGELTAALVQGLQGDHPRIFKTVATLKHFIGNNNEINRGSCSASIDPRNMKEYYQAAFKPAFVKGGAKSMMTSYNSVNGTPTILHEDVKRVVKEEWGMDGFIVSDAGDLLGIVNDHRYYATYKEAVAHAIKAGIDSITDDKEKSCEAIREALADGLLAESDLDEALVNTFGVRIRLGEFDPAEDNPYANMPEARLCSPEHAELSRRAAAEAIVLLKNEPHGGGKPLLPLSKEADAGRIAVVGPLADVVYRDWYSGTLPYKVTPLAGIEEAAGADRVEFQSGNDIVTLHCSSGRPLVLDAKSARLSVAEDTGAKPERFELTDWGWGSCTLRSLTNGKLLSSGDDVHLTANAEEAFGWFVKEMIGLKPRVGERDSYGLAAWNGKAVLPPKDGGALAIAAENESSTESGAILKRIESDGIEEAVRAAKSAETAIVVVGNNPLINGKEENDRQGLELPQAQQALIRAVLEANPRTIVVIVGSYPFALGDLAGVVPAILYTAHGSQELGHALSDIVFGEISPAGRLNMTWYQSEQQLTDMMDYDIMKSRRTYHYLEEEPLYPFGHGLSYARFAYGELEVQDETVAASDAAAAGVVYVAVTVKNESELAADEVIQLYVKVEGSRVQRPIKKLIAFRRVTIDSGESVRVEFRVAAEELAMWDVTRDRFVLESGVYGFMAGSSSADIRAVASVELVGGTEIPQRDLSVTTRAENYDDYESILLEENKEGGTCVMTRDGGAGWLQYNDIAPMATAGGGAKTFICRVLVGAGGGSLSLSLVNAQAFNGGDVIGRIELDPDGAGEWKDIELPLPGEHGILCDGGGLTIHLSGDVKLSSFRLI